MIDTLNLSFNFLDEATRKRAFAEIPKCFDNEPSEHFYPDSTGSKQLVLDGCLGSLKVSVSPIGVKVGNSSFAKWILGSNLKTLTRKDIQLGIKNLSDLLHLPMDEAKVTRLDFGCNLIMNYPIETYKPYLGLLQWFSRLEQPNGLYYNGANGQLAFYDKIKEIRHNGFKPPELYKDKNVLRYEVRIKHRLKEVLKVPEVTAKLLYNEQFYIGLWSLWRGLYYQIQKENETRLDFKIMPTVKEQNRIALVNWVVQNGGQTKYLKMLKNALKRGDISRKQEHDLRKAVEEAFSSKGNADVIKESESINELKKKIDEATRYFR